jgi:hypothetical protein
MYVRKSRLQDVRICIPIRQLNTNKIWNVFDRSLGTDQGD